MGIKNEIDALCKDLLMSNVNEYISVPIVLMVYLGEETYNVVNASLRDAFTTSFKAEPSVYDIKINSVKTTSQELLDNMVSAMQVVTEQGRRLDDLRISFVSLMDDEIYANDSLGLIDTIQTALTQLNNFGAQSNKISFYGIFRQSEMQKQYANAFSFVNAGKTIWKNIYHLEMSIFDSNIHKYTRLIAINVISDEQIMVQNAEVKEYNWQSICLHYLQVPELIVAKVLRKVYANQINGQNVNVEEWEANVNIELESVFEQKFSKEENHCEQFIPLCYYDESNNEEETVGLISRIFGKKKVQNEDRNYTHVIYDKKCVTKLLDEMYGAIEFSVQDNRQILERIISAASSIDNNHNRISQSIRGFLNKKVMELQQQLDNATTKGKFDNLDTSNATYYIQNVYEKEKHILILQKKIELINSLIDHLLESGFLNQLIQDICGKNRTYTNRLDELSQSEYGGTLEHEKINMTILPAFKVNQSVDEIIKGIGHDLLSQIINDEDTIYANLEQFLTHTLGNAMVVAGKHNLGEVNGTYNTLEVVNSALLVTPAKENEGRMQELLTKYPMIYTKSNSMYRENTFYMISSRIYSSDKYIVRYRR